MSEHYETTHEADGRRVRWVHDSDYRSEGSYALDMPENVVACAEEQNGLALGKLVALGGIVETLCGCCGVWMERDSVWGIVVGAGADLEALGDTLLDIPEAPPRALPLVPLWGAPPVTAEVDPVRKRLAVLLVGIWEESSGSPYCKVAIRDVMSVIGVDDIADLQDIAGI